MANPEIGGIDYELIVPEFFEFAHKDLKSTALFGLGFGYDTGHYFRFDVTGEYRGTGLFLAQDRYSDGEVFIATNEYTADIESWVGLANGYIDLGTWWCITPYVGGGVGFANISILGYKDVNVPVQSVAYGQDNTETNFAWALYAGLSYKVARRSPSTWHRYTDIGDIRTGNIATFDDVSTSGGFQIEDITSNDVMLSVRLALGSQPAPMPVAFK